jgi:hypothetical protein
MIFTVVYQPEIENDLADLWLNAPDRAAVTVAANTIDDQLRRNPYAMSESALGTLA